MTKAGSGVQLGHHYQANSGAAGEAIAHGVGHVTGARPLAIPRAFAHGIGAATSVILMQGQEREASVAPRLLCPNQPWVRGHEDPCPIPKALSATEQSDSSLWEGGSPFRAP